MPDPTMTARTAVQRLLNVTNLPQALGSHLILSSSAVPVAPSSFALGPVAQATIAASALSAAHLHQMRGGNEQSVTVDERHAALEFHSEAWTVLDGKPAPAVWDPLAGTYQTKDGYVRIHTNFPHHREGILKLLQCSGTKEGVSQALRGWSSFDFEQSAVDHGLCVTALRSFEQWDAHPQAEASKTANAVPVVIRKIGETPQKRRESQSVPPKRPLEGIRVLDLTRVIAGPVGGRTLAAHGADVLWITSPNLPDLPALDVDTSRGKRTAQLDLILPSDRDRLKELVKDADVFLQAYRPGALAKKGFGIEDVAKLKPGIVYASLNAYGWDGPWKDRRGFDSLVQTATGFNVAEAEAFNASGVSADQHVALKPLPFQAIDHAAGQLLALGINAALARTYTEGGTYEVRVSLVATANFIRSLPRLEPSVGFGSAISIPKQQSEEINALSIEIPISCGRSDSSSEGRDLGADTKPERTLIALKHAAILSETPVKVGEAPDGLAAHNAAWLDRASV